jgi:hypothetical protein
MDELVELVAQKTGISKENAEVAVETVLGFLKDKLPEPIGGQIDAILSGEGAGNLGDIAQSLGGLFGKKG